MNSQPNWAQKAADLQRPNGSNRQVLWGVVAVVSVVLVAAAIAMATTGDNNSNGAAVENSKSVTVVGDPLPAGPREFGLFESGTDPAVGKIIPTATATQTNGSTYTIKPGKPTLYLFVAHWCPHCQAEVPRIVEWSNAGLVPDGVDVVAISSKVNKDNNNFPPSEWMEREKWPYPVLSDTVQLDLFRTFSASGFPFFMAVDASGKVVQRGAGELGQDDFTTIIGQIAPK